MIGVLAAILIDKERVMACMVLSRPSATRAALPDRLPVPPPGMRRHPVQVAPAQRSTP